MNIFICTCIATSMITFIGFWIAVMQNGTGSNKLGIPCMILCPMSTITAVVLVAYKILQHL